MVNTVHKMSNKEIEKIHKALANHRRIATLRYLNNRRYGDLQGTARYLKLSYKATAKHFGQLCAAGILDKDMRHGIVYFSIAKDIPQLARHTLTAL